MSFSSQHNTLRLSLGSSEHDSGPANCYDMWAHTGYTAHTLPRPQARGAPFPPHLKNAGKLDTSPLAFYLFGMFGTRAVQPMQHPLAIWTTGSPNGTECRLRWWYLPPRSVRILTSRKPRSYCQARSGKKTGFPIFFGQGVPAFSARVQAAGRSIEAAHRIHATFEHALAHWDIRQNDDPDRNRHLLSASSTGTDRMSSPLKAPR